MIALTMNSFKIKVSFDGSTNKITFPRDSDADTFPLLVQQGIALITFDLQATNIDLSEFPSFAGTPVQWKQDGMLAALPPWFAMHWLDPANFALWDYNSNPGPSPKSHQFAVSVFYKNQFYTSTDPVIINEPPIGG